MRKNLLFSKSWKEKANLGYTDPSVIKEMTMSSRLKWFGFLFFTSTLLTSCAPPDDYYSTTPMTNNPNVIPQQSGGGMPGMSM